MSTLTRLRRKHGKQRRIKAEGRWVTTQDGNRLFLDGSGNLRTSPDGEVVSRGGSVVDNLEFNVWGDGPGLSIDQQKEVQSGLSKAMDVLGESAPVLRQVVVNYEGDLETKPLGSKSHDSIYFSGLITDENRMAAIREEWDGLIIGGMSVEAIIAHEYGHVAAGHALNKHPRKFNSTLWKYAREHKDDGLPIEGGGLYGGNVRSFYAQEDEGEWIAEAFADVALNGNKASTDSLEGVRLLKELLK